MRPDQPVLTNRDQDTQLHACLSVLFSTANGTNDLTEFACLLAKDKKDSCCASWPPWKLYCRRDRFPDPCVLESRRRP